VESRKAEHPKLRKVQKDKKKETKKWFYSCFSRTFWNFYFVTYLKK
jgi:hypothetical protein